MRKFTGYTFFLLTLGGCNLIADGSISHTCEDANACPDGHDDTNTPDDTADDPFDLDGDGYTEAEGDCNDNDAAINPGADEVCDDIDNDCDDLIDGQDDDITDGLLWYLDNDGDGYGQDDETTVSCTSQPAGYVEDGGDCNDTEEMINPDALDIVQDTIDQNCDNTDAELPFLSASQYHSCFLNTSGEIYCWGYSGSYSETSSAGMTTPPLSESRYSKISTGIFHTCAIDTEQQLSCLGLNDYGQMEHPEGSWLDLASTLYGSCALSTGGSISCWGTDEAGALDAPGDSFSRMVPSWGKVMGAFTSDGTLSLWGYENYGATAPAAGSNFLTVSPGYGYHACGISTDLEIECWGNEFYSMLEAPAGEYALVSTGMYHACALSHDGTIDCWGGEGSNSDYGQTSDSPKDGGYIHISSGRYHTCAVKEDESLTCWGNNSYGESDP